MVKILNRYILIQLLGPFLLGVGVFSLILLLAFIFELAEALFVKGIPWEIALLVLFLYIPTTFGYTVPMGVLLANLITWGRLKERGELTAIKASGVNPSPTILLVISASLILALTLYFFSDFILPRLGQYYHKILSQSIRSAEGFQWEEGVFIKIKPYELLIQKVDKRARRLKGIYIVESEEGRNPSRIIRARSGEYQIMEAGDLLCLQLLLKDGEIHQADREDPSRYHLLRFETHTLRVESRLEPLRIGVGELSSTELREKIKEYETSGLSPIPLIVEVHKRQAIPFACLAFTLIGIPLGLSTRRSGGVVGLGMSLVFIFVYYILLIGGESLALRGYVPAPLAIWLANLVLIFTGSILIMKVLKM